MREVEVAGWSGHWTVKLDGVVVHVTGRKRDAEAVSGFLRSVAMPKLVHGAILLGRSKAIDVNPNDFPLLGELCDAAEFESKARKKRLEKESADRRERARSK